MVIFNSYVKLPEGNGYGKDVIIYIYIWNIVSDNVRDKMTYDDMRYTIKLPLRLQSSYDIIGT